MVTKKGAKAKPSQPRLKIKYVGFLPYQIQIYPPDGYKWKLWSYGQYRLSVILEKLEADR